MAWRSKIWHQSVGISVSNHQYRKESVSNEKAAYQAVASVSSINGASESIRKYQRKWQRKKENMAAKANIEA